MSIYHVHSFKISHYIYLFITHHSVFYLQYMMVNIFKNIFKKVSFKIFIKVSTLSLFLKLIHLSLITKFKFNYI